ncbi:MAG: DUF488 domain-containing protein [Planctomycetes bacterium]|nr:DUF488 domain-containing protein [Planctomycetota bacterium]
MNIYTLGYSGWKVEEIQAMLEKLDAILVDVRMAPRSRMSFFNAGPLQKLLGERYLWLKDFGNRNYKGTFEQIEIVDFATGRMAIEGLVRNGRSIVLMCGCRDVEVCHRKVLAERLARLWKVQVMHLSTPASGKDDGSRRRAPPKLF